MAAEIDVNVSEEFIISGSEPVVILGPNGSGKTSLGRELSNSHQNSQFIAATRVIAVEESINLQSKEKANQNLRNVLNREKHTPWQSNRTAEQIFSKLKADDADSAIHYRNESYETPGNPPEYTSLYKLTKLWNELFPQRQIDFSTYQPTALWEDSSQPYSIQRLSDGERSVLLLAARIIDAPEGLLIIDEPELHMHALLAKTFWNKLEAMRNDCRFIYITHDVSFALSRRPANFLLLKFPNVPPTLIENEQLPSEFLEEIIGAATFSINARRVLFCEGEINKSEEVNDHLFYSVWCQDEEAEVIPVGSCEDVIKCVEVLNSNPAITGLQAIGIIDHDYWPEEFLHNLPEGIYPLGVHELENLFCLRPIFIAIAIKLGHEEQASTELYDQFLLRARESIDDGLKNKQIIERVKRNIEYRLEGFLNLVSPNPEMEIMRNNFLEAMDISNWELDPEQIFNTEREIVESALNGNIEEFLRIIPGKRIIGKTADVLGVRVNVYKKLVIEVLDNVRSELEQEMRQGFSFSLPN